MSFKNPTQLQLGMSGTLFGQRYRVVGRLVMGMEEEGETYYWNEFNLESDADEAATLVYEETERGGEWRLFRMFEPEFSMTAADAATRRVGDPLNLDGTPVRVTLVDESRVYHIEGKAPEGVEIGDVAHYFNCEAANKMQVVSWTGDEVEFYHGANLPRRTVDQAFGIRTAVPAKALLRTLDTGADPDSESPAQPWARHVIVLLAVAGVLFFTIGREFSCAPRRASAHIKKIAAPASALKLGSSGTLGGKTFGISSHAVVEISEVGRVFDQHEYSLDDEAGGRALLIHGAKPGANDWVVFTPLEPMDPLTPQQAAAIRAGQTVNINGYVGQVSQIFQTVVDKDEREGLQPSRVGDRAFGFKAEAIEVPLLVRWDNSRINFYRGKELQEKEVIAAFEK